MRIEFFLKERINSDVQGEAGSARSPGPELVIEIEATCALHKKIYLASGKTPFFAAVVPVSGTVGIIVFLEFGHRLPTIYPNPSPRSS